MSSHRRTSPPDAFAAVALRLRARRRLVPERRDPPAAARRVDRLARARTARAAATRSPPGTTCRCSRICGCAGAAAAAACTSRCAIRPSSCSRGWSSRPSPLRYGATPMTPVWCVFAAALIAAAVIDFDHQIIPDEISLGGLVVALVVVPAVRALGGEPFCPRSAAVASRCAARRRPALDRRLRSRPHLGRAGARVRPLAGRGRGAAAPAQRRLLGLVPGPGLRRRQAARHDRRRRRAVRRARDDSGRSLAGLVVGIAWAAAVRNWTAPFGFGPAIAAGALLVVLVPHRTLFSAGLRRRVTATGSRAAEWWIPGEDSNLH